MFRINTFSAQPDALCYALMFPSRKSGFRADTRQVSPISGPEPLLHNIGYGVYVTIWKGKFKYE